MLDQIWKKLECLRDRNKCICIPSYHHIISFESLQEKDLAFANVKGLCLGTEFCVLTKSETNHIMPLTHELSIYVDCWQHIFGYIASNLYHSLKSLVIHLCCVLPWLQSTKEVFKLCIFAFNMSSNVHSRKKYPLKGTGGHWKDWCWNSKTLATWWEEVTHWKRPWCWERLKAGGEGDDRGWDGWLDGITDSMDMSLSKLLEVVSLACYNP